VRGHLLRESTQLSPVRRAHLARVRGFSKSRRADLWRRRSSIICQLSFKAATDLGLLYACIDANLDDQDFFTGTELTLRPTAAARARARRVKGVLPKSSGAVPQCSPVPTVPAAPPRAGPRSARGGLAGGWLA